MNKTTYWFTIDQNVMVIEMANFIGFISARNIPFGIDFERNWEEEVSELGIVISEEYKEIKEYWEARHNRIKMETNVVIQDII